ncbi:MAG: hypothetical protein ACRYF2_12950 [Janthinobacterium lividum]
MRAAQAQLGQLERTDGNQLSLTNPDARVLARMIKVRVSAWP